MKKFGTQLVLALVIGLTNSSAFAARGDVSLVCKQEAVEDSRGSTDPDALWVRLNVPVMQYTSPSSALITRVDDDRGDSIRPWLQYGYAGTFLTGSAKTVCQDLPIENNRGTLQCRGFSGNFMREVLPIDLTIEFHSATSIVAKTQISGHGGALELKCEYVTE